MICGPTPQSSRARIYVADSRPNDYSALVNTADREVEFKFFNSARDALRSKPDEAPEMWIVNMNLPDIDGIELYGMLRARGCSIPILLVGDAYNVEDEITARSSGASLYFAKPLQNECLMAAGQYTA